MKNTAQLQFEKGEPPSGEYLLLAPWQNVRKMALRIDRAAQPHPLHILREVMGKKDTFIKKPDDYDDKLFIWGEQNKVVETKAALAHWVEELRQAFLQPKTVAWAKERALDGRAEHREDQQNKQKLVEQLLRDANIDFPVEAALLWPKDLDIDQFESANTESLDELRGNFGCSISFPSSDPEHIMIGAHSDIDAHFILTRITNLIKETISSRDQLVTVNLVHIPDHAIYRDRVDLSDKDPLTGTYLPTLHGKPASDEEILDKERRQVHVSNRKKVKKTIDSTIKRLRVTQQHVRMRVVFGELGFMLFQKPADGADTYTFEDFYGMVTRGRTRLRLNGLPVRQGEITDLVDVLDSVDAFSDRSEYYATFFDFQGTSQNTTLRLETLFQPIGHNDTEIPEKRWVELSDSVSRLQLSLFNFERPDYQITVDAFPLHTDKATKGTMAQFQANVTMTRPENGIKSEARQRVKYPQAGHKGLQRVSELTILKWRFRMTDGIFELRRKDTYDLRPGREGSSVETRWHALYYYPEWDNLMGDFASIKPGEDVKWVKSVATFFPEGGDQWTALPQGFKNFINEVEEIQDLLAEAIGRVAKGKGKAKELNGEADANGV